MEGQVKTRQDKTNSLFPRVVNKHTSAFLHSALAQRGTNLLRILTADAILHTLKTCTLSIKNSKETRTREKTKQNKNKTRQTKRANKQKPRRDTEHRGREGEREGGREGGREGERERERERESWGGR